MTALCTVFGWAFFVSGPLAADTIVKLNGASIDNVKIIQAKWDLVQYQTQGRGGRAQSVAAAQIASIDREARGSALIEGRAASQKGDYPGAIRPLTSATKRGGSEAWEKAEAAYRLGEAYLQVGKAKEAFSMRTLPPVEEATDRSAEVRTASREKYGRSPESLKADTPAPEPEEAEQPPQPEPEPPPAQEPVSTEADEPTETPEPVETEKKGEKKLDFFE